MTRLVLFIAALLTPAVALGEPLAVRSGEHAGFTRLVIYAGQRPDWSLDQTATGYRLQVDGATGYDLSTVWQMIGRDRIADLAPGPGGRLDLRLACECHADPFEIPQGLVLDVRDGPPPGGSPFEATAGSEEDSADPPAEADPPPEEETAADRGPPDADPSGTVIGPRPLVLPGLLTRADGGTGPGLNAPAAVPLAPPSSAPEAPASAAPETLEAVAEELARQIARAASQGLVEVAVPEEPEPVAAATRAPSPADTSPPVASEPDPFVSEGNLRIQSVIDRDRIAGGREALTEIGEPCVPDEKLDLSGWGRPPDPLPDLASLRSGWFGERDDPRPEAVERAVRGYLYLGFGAEAHALLDGLASGSADAGLYRELAQVIDGKPVPNGRLAGQIGCDSAVALWAVLARPELSASDPVIPGAVIAAFAGLPLHLRRHLGPRLARSFLASGDGDTAAALRNFIARAPGDHGAGLNLLEAELAAGTDPETADARLLALAGGNGDPAVDALVKLISLRSELGRPIGDDLLNRAEGLAFEHRGTPRGAALAHAHALGLVADRRLPAAFGAIARLRADNLLPETELRNLTSAAVEALADDPAFATLLPRILDDPPALGSGPRADSARRALALRMILSGLPRPARHFLLMRPEGPGEPDRLLIARSYLAEARPELALGVLVGIDAAAAAKLRAQAHLLQGSPALAADILESLGEADAAADAAWRAGEWRRAARLAPEAARTALLGQLLDHGAPAQTETRDPADASGPPPPAGGLTLAQGRDLLGESAETRAALRRLLGEPD